MVRPRGVVAGTGTMGTELSGTAIDQQMVVEERWPVPQMAMLVVVASATLWLSLIVGVRWLVA